jgi:hypothetical protein
MHVITVVLGIIDIKDNVDYISSMPHCPIFVSDPFSLFMGCALSAPLGVLAWLRQGRLF